MPKPHTLIHATLLSIDSQGVLFTGPSGAGKSDLALRLITTKFSNDFCRAQPQLVADDQVQLEVKKGQLYGACPPPLKGLLEVRALGIEQFPYIPSSQITFVIALKKAKEVERMPPQITPTIDIEGIELPLISLDPFENSAPQKVLLCAKNRSLLYSR